MADDLAVDKNRGRADTRASPLWGRNGGRYGAENGYVSTSVGTRALYTQKKNAIRGARALTMEVAELPYEALARRLGGAPGGRSLAVQMPMY